MSEVDPAVEAAALDAAVQAWLESASDYTRLRESIAAAIAAYKAARPAVDEAMVERAGAAVVAEWKVTIREMSPGMGANEIARAFVSPGNHRLVRAAITAALEG